MRERGGGSGVFFSSSTNSCFLQRIPGSAKRARHVGLDKNDLLMEARPMKADVKDKFLPPRYREFF